MSVEVSDALDKAGQRAEADRQRHHGPEGETGSIFIEDTDGQRYCVGCWWCEGPPTEAHGWML